MIGYEGIFSIEFIVSNGVAYFLEINMRNDGVSYIYSSAGINYPYASIKYCQDKSVDYLQGRTVVKDITAMQMADLNNLITGRINPITWINQLSECRCFFVFSLKDPKPFIYQLYIPFRQLIIKITQKND